ncbi:Outer membrane porin protein BP0840 [Massilia sp. Bi118]|uniref:porin n=1 Tax=Massilia sp. Bi118 TaxID=2822346 RepID=UPI001DF8876B|nr:porin [Massilia sp. Bi118]CAH0317661.1 Outer membrane porin protein BP0840 [Massilia sp. Bi118]
MTQFITRKTLLAAAALACLSNVSMAETTLGELANLKVDTTIYGFLNGQLESVQAQGGATPYSTRGRVSDGNSRLGFRGNIGVTDDLKGVWQLEAALNNFDQGGVNTRGESTTLSSRNSYVGVESAKFGTFVVGNNDSVYRSLIGSGGEFGGNLGLTVHGLDVWNNTSAQLTGNADSIFSRGEARYKNSAHYLSPVYYGFQVGASYGFDENQESNTNRGRWSVAAKYTLGAFSIGAGYDRQNNTGVDTDAAVAGYGFRTMDSSGVNTSFAKVIGRYRLPTNTTIGLGFEQGKYGYEQVAVPTAGNFYTGTTVGTMKQNAVMLSLAQDIGKASIMASAGKLFDLKGATFGKESDYAANQYSIGAIYNLNRYLSPYVYYTKIRNHAQQNVNLGQAPVYSNNAGKEDAFLAPGNSPRAFGVGLIARF